jgi:dipeptidyl aminopeptidase/acylaminoacyl peptidase
MDLAFRPDGEAIAFVLRTTDLEQNRHEYEIYVVPTARGKPRRVTTGETKVRHPRWSPSGDYLAFLRTPRSEDEKAGGDQLWLLPMHGGEAFRLTAEATKVLDFAWSPDGRAVYVLAPEEKPSALEGYEEEREQRGFTTRPKDKDIPPKLLWRYPVPEGERQLVFRGDPGIASFAVRPDGSALVFRSNGTGVEADEDAFEVYLLRIQDGRVRRLTNRVGDESSLHWTHDGSGVIVQASQIDTLSFSQQEIFVIPLGDNPFVEPAPVPFARWTPWTDRLDREVDSLLWPERSGPAFVVAQDGLTSRLVRLDGEGGGRWLTDPELLVRTGAASPDGRWLALVVEGPEDPPRLVLADADGDIRRTLMAPNAEAFAEIRPARQESFRWTSKDGLEVEGLLTYPWWEDAQPPYPLLVLIHGGPSWHATARLVQEAQAWAAEGYLVFSPNYRGSTGYGNAFVTANLRDLGGGDMEDILSGVDRLVADGLADPERMAVAGGSYGGYMTNRIISRTTRFAAAVSKYGIFSLITDFSMSDYPLWEHSYLRAFYWEELEPYLRMSPAFDVENIRTPVLILHGEEDNNTFIANSMEMYQALRLLGRTVEFHRIPREGHGFREPHHVIEAFRLMRSWLDRWVTKGALWPPEYEGLASVPREFLPPTFADRVRSLGGLPRLFRPGDTLRVEEGWQASALITRLRVHERLGAERAQDRFLEVELLLHPESSGGTLTLDSENLALLAPTGQAFRPVGVPVEAHGEISLVRAERILFRSAQVPGNLDRWDPLRIVFEVPAGRSILPLVLGPFPPVLVNLGEADVHR